MSNIRYNNGKWKDTTLLRKAIRFTEKGYYCESPICTQMVGLLERTIKKVY